MTEAERPEGYHPADKQLFETTGLDVGPEAVIDATETTTEKVLRAINTPNQWSEEKIEMPDGTVVTRSDPTDWRWLPKLDLPGFGSERDDCGDEMPLFCDGCGATKTVGRTCKQSTCPRCAAAWCRDRAISVAARLDATRRMRAHTHDEHQRFHHLAFSPPSDWKLEAEDVLQRSFRVVGDVLDAMGLDGYVFYHPWSGDTEEGDDDRGKWKDRLFNGKEWSQVKKELKPRPHFHVVAVGHHVPGGQLTKRVESETGWIINRITQSEESKVSIYDDEALCRVVAYCISHTGLEQKESGKRVAYRKYGRTINDADVYDDKKRRIDLMVRKTVPKTLGVDLGEQICEKETKPGVVGFGMPTAMSLLNDGEEHGSGDGSADGSGSDDSGGEEIAAPSSDGSDVGPEKAPCEGRLLPIKAAHRNPNKYHENPTWLENAEHGDQLQLTLDAWADEIDDLPG